MVKERRCSMTIHVQYTATDIGYCMRDFMRFEHRLSTFQPLGTKDTVAGVAVYCHMLISELHTDLCMFD
jgi:hypothetical protein